MTKGQGRGERIPKVIIMMDVHESKETWRVVAARDSKKEVK